MNSPHSSHPALSSQHELVLLLPTNALGQVVAGARLLPIDSCTMGRVAIGLFANPDLGHYLLRFLFEEGELEEELTAEATSAGIVVIAPGKLSAEDREAFRQHLSQYPLRIRDCQCALDAIDRLHELLAASHSPLAQGTEGAFAVHGSNQGSHISGSHPPDSGSHPPDSGTHSTSNLALSKQGEETSLSIELGPAGRSAVASSAKRRGRGTSPVPRDRLKTEPLPPHERLAPQVVFAGASSGIAVRFSRGDTWMPARLRNLTLRGVRIAASAAPPLGSNLRISLKYAGLHALVSGRVNEVINTEKSADGTTSLRIEFFGLEKRDRNTLAEILRTAQKRGVSLSTPPPRKNRRFSIRLPVSVLDPIFPLEASVHNVSEGGLFIATTEKLHESHLELALQLDNSPERIEVEARIARELSLEKAQHLGLSAGYGIEIRKFSQDDRQKYLAFLERVKLRSQRHVLIAGSGEHCEQFANHLSSLGYAVSQSSSLEAMLARANREAQRPDLALVHPSCQVEGFASAFHQMQVPILEITKHPSTELYIEVDQWMISQVQSQNSRALQ